MASSICNKTMCNLHYKEPPGTLADVLADILSIVRCVPWNGIAAGGYHLAALVFHIG